MNEKTKSERFLRAGALTILLLVGVSSGNSTTQIVTTQTDTTQTDTTQTDTTQTDTTQTDTIQTKTTQTDTIQTYYVYSASNQLLAEYENGECVKEYIYAGDKLVAEYNPEEGTYLYYTTDQIGSTRVVTNEIGDVVYSAAYGPYGDLQLVWNDLEVPKAGFSGKERERHSGIDYFSARYFSHQQKRFLSVDPVMTVESDIIDPQRWNLYAYANNNPLTYRDPDGRNPQVFQLIYDFAQGLGPDPPPPTLGGMAGMVVGRIYELITGENPYETFYRVYNNAFNPYETLKAFAEKKIKEEVIEKYNELCELKYSLDQVNGIIKSLEFSMNSMDKKDKIRYVDQLNDWGKKRKQLEEAIEENIREGNKIFKHFTPQMRDDIVKEIKKNK